MDRPAAFWREHPDGTREVAGRVWVLIWIFPVLMLLAGAVMVAAQGYRVLTMAVGEGEVTRVYCDDRATRPNCAPVLRYTWSDGQPTEASVGLSHPDWNFEIGSRHAIRYVTDVKANIQLVSPSYIWPGFIVLGLGALSVLPAGFAARRLRRWQRAGA